MLVDPAEAVEKVNVYVVRCPHGQDCSKGGRILAKKISEKAARLAVQQHLVASPYHAQDEVAASLEADAVEVETWEEDAKNWSWADEDAAEWYSSRKRIRSPSRDPPSTRSSSSAQRAIGAPAAQHGVVAKVRKAPSDELVLTRAQAQAMVDSLKRAKSATQAASQLCKKASKVFDEEACCIDQCMQVLESYM